MSTRYDNTVDDFQVGQRVNHYLDTPMMVCEIHPECTLPLRVRYKDQLGKFRTFDAHPKEFYGVKKSD